MADSLGWPDASAVRVALAEERIRTTPDAALPDRPVTSARTALAMAEVIRQHTLHATQGKTYAETPPFLDAHGVPVADRSAAARDPRTGEPLENPARSTSLAATTLRTTLMQAFIAFRLADFTIAVGALFVTAGAGVGASHRNAT